MPPLGGRATARENCQARHKPGRTVQNPPTRLFAAFLPSFCVIVGVL